MEIRTITIKSVGKSTGTKQDGTEWRRTSIKATDGKFYSCFTELPEEAITQGSELKVEVIPSKLLNTYEIQKLISYALPKRIPKDEGRGDTPTPSVANAPRHDIDAAAEYAAQPLKAAVKTAHLECPGWESMSEYPYLLGTLIQAMHGHISNKQIAEENERKYKMWGNKI